MKKLYEKTFFAVIFFCNVTSTLYDFLKQFLLQGHPVNTTEFASIPLGVLLATVPKDSPAPAVKPTSMNANLIPVKTMGPVWMILERFDAFVCPVSRKILFYYLAEYPAELFPFLKFKFGRFSANNLANFTIHQKLV